MFIQVPGQAIELVLVVEVTVKDNKITNITIVSHNERNQQIYGKAMTSIPDEIISSQSLNVDTVTKKVATRTSNGILDATKNALEQAVISGTLN